MSGGAYGDLGNEALRELLRGRDLPTYGNKAALTARLVAADEAAGAAGRGGAVAPAPADDELDPDAWADAAPPAVEPTEIADPEPAAPAEQPVAETSPVPAAGPTSDDAPPPVERSPAVFRVEYPVEGAEFSDEQHWRCVADVAAQARAAGHTPLASGGHRTGWGTAPDGGRTAVYEIDLRR